MDPSNNATKATTPYNTPETHNRYNSDQQEPERKSTQCNCQLHPFEQPEERSQWLQNLSTAIKQITLHKNFKVVFRRDSISTISKKLHFIFNEIRNLTQEADILTASVWMDIWAVIAKFISNGMMGYTEDRGDAKIESSTSSAAP